MSMRERLRAWFFRRQAPQSGEIVLDRRRIYILPTRTGIFYSLVLVVMYVGAVNYNLGLGHALVFLLVGLGIVGMLHTFRNLAGLVLRAGRATPVFAGDNACFEVLLANRRGEPRLAITVQFFAVNAAFPARTADLPGAGTTTVMLARPTERRGRLPLDRLVLSSRYPLGLFRAWSYPWPDMHCLVYPAPLFRPLPPPQPSDKTAGVSTATRDEQDDFAGFRRHQPGDSLRHVAWKIYARDAVESPLQVKEFSGNGPACYWFDWASTDPAGDTETRLSILCGWVLQAQRDEAEFGLRLPGRQLAPERGGAHVRRALEALALFGEAGG